MKLVAHLLVLALAAAGCASTAGGDGADGGTAVNIEVDNTTIPSSDITVYLVSSAGTRQLVGSVGPNRVETLRFTRALSGGQYRLLARATAGGQVVSNSFIISGRSGVRWTLRSNIAVPVD